MTKLKARALGLACCLAVSSPFSFAEVLGSNAAGFALRVEAVAPVGMEEAWQRLVHPELWWDSSHTWSGSRANLSLELSPGGCFCEQSGGLAVQHLTVSQVRSGSALVMLGGLGPLQAMGLHGAASFTLEALEAGGTKLVHEYRVSGYSAEGFAELAKIVNRVQQGQVDSWAASFGD